MSLPVILDFSQVEEALKLSSREREILTARERTKNTAKLIKYAAVGIALIIASGGIALWLAKEAKIVHLPAPPTAPSAPIQWPAPSPHSGPSNKVVTNLTLFNAISKSDLGFSNPFFVSLNAGHKYNNSNADHWDTAWCYANFEKDLMKLKIDLATRSKTNTFTELVSQRELRELNLREADVTFLRSQCPWKG